MKMSDNTINFTFCKTLFTLVKTSTVETSTVGTSTFTSSTVGTSTFTSSTVKTSTVTSSTIGTSTIPSSMVTSSTVGTSTVTSSKIGTSMIKSSVKNLSPKIAIDALKKLNDFIDENPIFDYGELYTQLSIYVHADIVGVDIDVDMWPNLLQQFLKKINVKSKNLTFNFVKKSIFDLLNNYC